MSESCLSQKISLCRFIDTLNYDGCLQVIRLLQQSQNCDCLNQFLIKILMKMTDKMDVELLQHIHNEIKQISCNNNYTQMEQSKIIDNKPKQQASENCASNKKDENTIFSLFRLPIDIIKNTSLFLNEKDIFNFEKCCRLFYQMINNLSYLRQSNNFKTFILDNKRFDQISDTEYSFYKYSRAHASKMTVAFKKKTMPNQSVTQFINQTQSNWTQAKCIDKYNGYWLTNLFKSIKSLYLDADPTIVLLDKLPLSVLFDQQSHLERFSINYSEKEVAKFGNLQSAIDKFERQYLEFKQKCHQQGKKIQRLKYLMYSCACVKGDNKITCPRFIEAEQLILTNVCQRLAEYACAQLQRSFSTIRVLTCIGTFNIRKLDKISDCSIDTLSLISVFADNGTDICDNEKVVEALNLDSNLMNLTIEIDMWPRMRRVTTNDMTRWIKCFETILCKKYYYNLKNVNMLIQICERDINHFFNMLKKNISILKCQFNQLNIGIRILCHDCTVHYCTFEWNPQMDEKYLDKQKQEMNGDKIKYKQWMNQWTN